jgi:glycosyltransferase involved in cell wall biosynthesis
VIGVNQEIVDVFKRYGLPPERLKLIEPHYLPEGVPDIELPEPFRSFFTTHNPVLLSVGLLEPEYDLSLQIRVVGLLQQRLKDVGLIIIGSGSLEPSLRKAINLASYAEHVLLAGDVERQVTLKVIADSDIYLRTTLFDGDSISLREAIHFGVPAIASDRARRPKQVRVIPAENIHALHDAVLQELEESTRGAASKEADVSNLNAVLQVYQELYQSKSALMNFTG